MRDATAAPPRPTIAANNSRFVRVIRCISTVFDRLYSVWERVQVSRHGAYTSRRARALDRYVYSKSLARVLAVCILTPIPVLTFVLLQELVPLDTPAAGWRANYGWFARSTMLFTVLTLSYIQQGAIFLAPLQISWRQTLVLTLCTTGAYFGVLVGVSDLWIFPIPFACVLTTAVFPCLFFGFFFAVVGWEAVATTPRISANARIFRGVLVVETIILLVYPAFNAVFLVLHGAQQLAFFMVLFALKVLMRFLMAYALRHSKGGARVDERWRARLPEVVVFSTELFHVLYLTACLQGENVTIWATIGLSLLDATSSVINVRWLLRRCTMELIRKPMNHESGGDVFHSLKDFSLVPRPALSTSKSLRAISPASKPALSTSRSLRSVVPILGPTMSTQGHIGPTLTTSQFTGPILKQPRPSRLSAIDSSTSARFSSRRRSSLTNFSAGRRLSVAISSVSQLKLARRSSSRASSRSSHSIPRVSNTERKKSRPTQLILRLHTEELAAEVSRLEMLSKTEYFLLIEYVKCIIPTMYGIFQVVVARLPNAVYYPSLANATPQDLCHSQRNMAVFVAMKVTSLAIFMGLLHRRLRFSVLHQLAFVLETAADDIQAKLAMFIPYCFFFFLQHNGVDYSFRFAWTQTT